jgi:mono/diheme cytochrome c family protein
MKHTVVVTVVVVSTMLASNVWMQEVQETYVLWGDPQKGRKVYAENGCATCHAVRGVGGTLGPDLGRPPLQHKTVTQMAGVMWNHATEMSRLAKTKGITIRPFAASELLDLLTYLYSLYFLDEPGNARQGARLFVNKGCAACHAIKGDRPAIGPPLARFRQYASPILWAEVMWRHAVEMEQKMKEMGIAWPRFEKNEMVDLISYVRSAAQPQKP